MKPLIATIVLVLIGTLAMAQSTTPQTPPAGAQTGSSSGSAQSTAPAGTPRGQMQGQMRARHMQAMQNMQQSIAKMRSLLDQMKANTASMTGKDKAAMEANVQLWQMMIDHMSEMAQHMSEMQGMKGGRMMHHGMGAGSMGGPGSMQGPASAPPTPPEQSNPPTPPQK